jgi:hypothetical protein
MALRPVRPVGRRLVIEAHYSQTAASQISTPARTSRTTFSQITAHAEVPPRVEYEPSELAATLIPHAVALANWAIEHNPDIDAHR